MPISTIPDFPVTGDPDFNSKAYAWALHLANVYSSELTALAADVAASNGGAVSATTTSSTLIGTGSKTFTIQTGKAFAVGQFVVVASTASPTNWMYGTVTAHNSVTGSLTVNVTQVSGTGTLAAWAIAAAGPSATQTDVQVFSGSGTWTKPGFGSMVMVELLGGGGGGAQSASGNNGGGGGGGAYVCEVFAISALAATESVSIGAGGTNASPGGTTTFGTKLSAFGGGGGATSGFSNSGGGGGGGGSLQATGSNATAAASATVGGGGGPGGVINGIAGAAPGAAGNNSAGGAGTGTASDKPGGGGGGGAGGGGVVGGPGGGAVDGGGGGGGGGATVGGAGAGSHFGGAGGGGAGGSAGGAAGVSKNPLCGPAGTGATAAGNPTAPGVAGGGGGTRNTSSLVNGGPGYARITTF